MFEQKVGVLAYVNNPIHREENAGISKSYKSSRYKNWLAVLDIKTCAECRRRHGKIYSISDIIEQSPPLHLNCRCVVIEMDTVVAGEATDIGQNGADYHLLYFGSLPDYYISEDQAHLLNWKRGRSLDQYAKGKMITMGRYYNYNGHLPEAYGRVWYEADINYNSGRRNTQRIVWSNDGLVFVTYDHYQSFIEVVR